ANPGDAALPGRARCARRWRGVRPRAAGERGAAVAREALAIRPNGRFDACGALVLLEFLNVHR
ncbi:hypothetical protein, partial [Agromyces seonyuensis]|uniref:hypothetical protein n=1 Tax=Agromyces seonyuensis TaxID=2662446 RepID=UPI001F333548